MSHSDIQKINSTEVMSAVTVFNQVVYLSGQVPKNPDLDIEGQTRDVLATIEQLLASANSDKSRLLSVQLFLKYTPTLARSPRFMPLNDVNYKYMI